MFQFLSGFQIDMEMVHQTMRSMLTKLGDHRSLTVNTIEVLASLTQLFPNSFKEKLCEQLLVS
jgi:transformation/transcription domain-associated protein